MRADAGRCPACGAGGMEIFHEQEGLPAHSCLLLDDAREARSFPRGSLRLGFCHACGFITNTAFDASLHSYSSKYEETQGFSARFRAFAHDLASRWVDRYDLRGRHILEIGCGKGEFLVEMCEVGGNRGTGIDPGVIPARLDADAADRIDFIQDLYSEKYSHLAADAIVCRHTLEHISPVADFMTTIRRSIGDRTGTIVLFELPDVVRVLEETAFWDVYYEHCSYFSLGSLARLFRATGFEVLDLSLDYDDQYLLLEARPAGTPAGGRVFEVEDDLDRLAAAVAHFSSTYPARVAEWRGDLERRCAGGRRAVIWGSGSKGVAYLTTLGLQDEIDAVVDINPFKQGMYMAGTGHRIVAPESLKARPPDLVVAMNPIYLDEIRHDLDTLGIDAELVAV